MIQITYPWLFMALPLPILYYYLLPPAEKFSAKALKVPFFKQLTESFNSLTHRQTKEKLSFFKYLLLSCWILLIISASGIQWLGTPLPIQQSGRELMMAIDLSGSMQTLDMQIQGQKLSRIDLVKQVANQFIQQRSGDRLGLILFGTRPYLQTPLTFDRKTVGEMLNDATIGLAGPQTAIGDAIGLAIKQLIKMPSSSKAIILLTDGGNNSGILDPLNAAQLAAKEHIKIYTIGLGANSMQVQTLFGSRTVNPSSDLDIESLKKIATLTGGEFFRAEDGNSLQAIYAQINQLEPIKSDQIIVRPITPLYPWTLGAALILSFFLALFMLKKDSYNA